MGNNGSVIVLIIVITAVAAGFLFSVNNDLASQIRIANDAIYISTEKLVTADAQQTADGSVIAQRDGELAQANDQLATSIADVANAQNRVNAAETAKATAEAQAASAIAQAAVSKEQADGARALATTAEVNAASARAEADAASTQLATAAAQVQSQQTAVAELNRQNLVLQNRNKELENQVAQQALKPATTLTPVPQAGGFPPTGQAKRNVFTWLPLLGIGLFGGVVYASYRILKMDDQPSRPARSYGTDANTVYIKMTRNEARSYARVRSKGKR